MGKDVVAVINSGTTHENENNTKGEGSFDACGHTLRRSLLFYLLHSHG